MATLEIMNAQNKKVGEIALAEPLLKDKVNKAVLHMAVKAHLASRHHGTVDTKTRAEVLRTTKKVYRQKGTGNARHGSMKSAPFVGGGRVFGPHPRDYSIRLNKKTKHLALREALKSRIIGGGIMVVEKIPLDKIKTKDAVGFLAGLGLKGGLVILEAASETIEKSIRNIRDFKLVRTDQLNVFDLLKYPKILFTAGAFEKVQGKYLL